MRKDHTIGVFFGSRSPEHDISIITGQLILSALTAAGKTALPIYVAKNGQWYADDTMNAVGFFAADDVSEQLEKIGPSSVDFTASQGRMVLTQQKLFGKSHTIDLAFPAFHGTNGEDGTMQGLFELIGIPYVGCGVSASAIAMNKTLTKQFYRGLGIATTDFAHYTKKQWQEQKDEILASVEKNLGFPVMVKPPLLGSSIGISKASSRDELSDGIDVALHYDTTALIEVCVENLMDVTCCVIGNNEPRASELQESVFDDDLFSYDDKYLNDGGAQLGKAQNALVIPARLDDDTTKAIKELSTRIFSELGCSGIARVDFLYDKKEKVVFANEINPLPGTLYHHLWKKSGVSLEELVLELVDLAQEKHAEKQSVTETFDSSILSKAESAKLKKAS